MATNQARWVGNFFGASEPFVIRGLFQAGGSQAIKIGELLELSGGNWIPLDADQSMAAVIAVANEEIKDGDRAGYYEIIVPRPGDVFEYSNDAADNPSVGDDLYWISSESVTTATGSNVLGNSVGQSLYPAKQEHLSEGGVANMGTTVRSGSYVQMTIKAAASYYAAMQT